MTKKTASITTVLIIAIGLFTSIGHTTIPKIPATSTEETTPSNIIQAGAPTQKTKIFFNRGPVKRNNFNILGTNPENNLEFTIRKDRIATNAQFYLQFTPSPSLIPLQSQLKVYLNDELVGIVAFTEAMLGKSNQMTFPIDTQLISDFNRLKLQFIGHYKAVCESPANTSLWVEISKESHLEITTQTLKLKNDLTHFPEPFFDKLDNNPLNLPVVFAQQPDLMQQRAAAIVTSWFGALARWRGESFKVLYNTLPSRNAIVFVTSTQKPDFLKNYITSDTPKIEMINHPNNPFIKLLVISGHDSHDLITAAKGIATGSILFSGTRVFINKVDVIAPRKPYDAPFWVRTDRPTTFEELLQFKEQLQAKGFHPNPIKLPFSVPPDLFLHNSPGIKVSLKYRYTAPPVLGGSQLNVSLNNYFVDSFGLKLPSEQSSKILGVIPLSNANGSEKEFSIPVLDVGTNNELAFDFAYANSIGKGGAGGTCETFTLVDNFAAIDNDSTIDFSNYHHYITMPNLAVFANAGFPFTRMADLSETRILMSKNPLAIEVTTLLNTMGNMGSKTGFPVLGVNLSNDWSSLKRENADILIIGRIPNELYDHKGINFLMKSTENWVNSPFRQEALPEIPITPSNAAVNNKTVIHSDGILAAIIGMQSPYFKHRNIVGLLADTPRGFELLNHTFSSQTLISQIFGSVVVIKESGIQGVQVGPVYHIGHLSWYLKIWLALQEHPINMAIASLLAALMITFILWRALLAISRRRLKK